MTLAQCLRCSAAEHKVMGLVPSRGECVSESVIYKDAHLPHFGCMLKNPSWLESHTVAFLVAHVLLSDTELNLFSKCITVISASPKSKTGN